MARQRRALGGLGVSMLLHGAVLLLLLAFVTIEPEQVESKSPPVRLDVVYLPAPDAGGGGGGARPARLAPVEIPRHVPEAFVPTPLPPPAPPLPTLDAPVETNLARVLQGGAIALAPPGPGGTGGRSQLGDGGPGPGLGPGPGPGPGGPGPGSGAGVTPPTLIRRVEPTFTPEALRLKIQGTVVLEAVVLADGTVGGVKIGRSLDARSGLDAEAVSTAKKWLFRPATQKGRPVDVVVTLILEFRVH